MRVAVALIAPVVVAALLNGNHSVAMIDTANEPLALSASLARIAPLCEKLIQPVRRTISFTYTMSFPFRSAATITGADTYRATITATPRSAARSEK